MFFRESFGKQYEQKGVVNKATAEGKSENTKPNFEEKQSPTQKREEKESKILTASDEKMDPPKPEKTPELKAGNDFDKKYTLVLDLDETLIHYNEEDEENGRVNFRPFLDEFLIEMRQHFNLIVFTASLQEYADPILDHLDPEGSIFSKRFYRHHTSELTEGTVKDLGILNTDLSKVIIVDNLPENFIKHKDNGIFIKPWYDDPNDSALREIGTFLKKIVRKNVEDVRTYLSDYRKDLIKSIQLGNVISLF